MTEFRLYKTSDYDSATTYFPERDDYNREEKHYKKVQKHG